MITVTTHDVTSAVLSYSSGENAKNVISVAMHMYIELAYFNFRF